MAPPTPTPDSSSPRSTYKVMTLFALIGIVLICVAIFSLSKIPRLGWDVELKTPDVQATLTKPIPAFESDELKSRLGTWVLLSFWSVTCPPCLAELPEQDQLMASWQGQPFQIVTVNVDAETPEDFDAAKKLIQEGQIDLPTIYDTKGALKAAFGVNVYPKHFLISPEQKIVWEAEGGYKWNDPKVRDQLAKLMEQQAPAPTEDPQE